MSEKCRYYREWDNSANRPYFLPYCIATKYGELTGCGGETTKCEIKNGGSCIMRVSREDILNQAKECVCVSREADYSSPENSFNTIARMWTSYLDAKGFSHSNPLTSKDVAAMMVLFKMSRVATGRNKTDNWVDAAGYAACGGEVEMAELESISEDMSEF